MQRDWWSISGIVGGAILILSSFAHSTLGWDAMAVQLKAIQAPADLAQGLRVGWQFGGVAMLVFGILVVLTFSKRMQGGTVTMTPMWLVSAGYLLFGTWALVMTGFDPFLLLFIVPSILIGVASAKT